MKQSFLKCMQIRVLSANLEAEIQQEVAFSLILGNIKRIIMNSGKSNYPLRIVFCRIFIVSVWIQNRRAQSQTFIYFTLRPYMASLCLQNKGTIYLEWCHFIQTKFCALSVMQYFHQGLTSLVCKLDASNLQRSQSKLELSMQKQDKDTSPPFASAESYLGQGNHSLECICSTKMSAWS